MEIILLENIEKLGEIGNIVNVKNGYGRNFLIPQGKALLATKDNKAFFESQKAAIEEENKKRLADAEKDAKKLEGKFFVLIRQAGDDGRLYGSVNARDIARAVSESSKVDVNKSAIFIEKPIKEVGAYPTKVKLHSGVAPLVYTVVARSEDEAKETEATFKNEKNKSDDTQPSAEVESQAGNEGVEPEEQKAATA